MTYVESFVFLLQPNQTVADLKEVALKLKDETYKYVVLANTRVILWHQTSFLKLVQNSFTVT